ncbi:MAG: NAD(P)H-quinone oxidoreductase [Deltaproteobacteria bacterium]|nr:NAD(P)H-quinone oxidoreductase [Deltaproteobacteria bacterium]
MQAIVIHEPGDENVMKIGEVPDPVAGPEDVTIRVHASAVNRADLLQRRGFYPPPPGASEILGLECAGVVEAVGGAVPVGRFARGERVMALLAGGGYAERVAVHHGSVMRVPDALDLVAAGGFPEVYLTAYLNLFLLGRLQRGGSALVHGGGSGVGTAAIRLLREAGAEIYVTAGSAAKCRRCVELGATAAIDYKTEDFAERIRELTGGRGVDVVLDAIGGSYFARNVASLATGGRLVVIGLTGGASSEINLATLMLKRLHVIGSTLRTRSATEKAEIVASFEQRFGAAVAAGRLGVTVDRVLPLAQAPEAHRAVAASEHFGKVVLQVG